VEQFFCLSIIVLELVDLKILRIFNCDFNHVKHHSQTCLQITKGLITEVPNGIDFFSQT
jgi:hypothetical protein